MAKFARLAFLGIGFLLLAVVLSKVDLNDLLERMSALGILGVFAILCVYWLYFGADTFSWHLVLPRVPITPSWYFRLFAVRMIGEAYNNITPTASLGGEPIKAWLLKSNWGISLRHSGSSLVVAKTTSMFSLVVFVGIGALLLAYHPNLTPRLESIVMWGLVFMVLSSVVLFLNLWAYSCQDVP